VPAAGNAYGAPLQRGGDPHADPQIAPFIEGITVSGGEATTQLPFLIALFTAIKADPALHHLTCLVTATVC
jgi:pyruvate-formate lyase-activating enzyme